MSKANGSAKSGSAHGASEKALELPLVNLPGSHPCHDCGQCCRYIATEIDAPTTFNDYENLHWYLLHEDICVYIDWEGDWFIEFTARCRHLTAENTCGIYEERPKICSDFSWDECEVSTKERAWKYRFDSYPDFLKWLEERRPKSYEKYVRARRQLIRKRQQKARKAAPPTAEPSAAEAGA